MRLGRLWPHRNTPRDVAARQDFVRRSPGWGAQDEVVLRFPAEPDGLREALGAVSECLTGQVTLPVSVVGPLRVDLGRYALDDAGKVVEVGRAVESVFVPLAHTEGGLSASMHRGCLATQAGTIRTFVLADRMTRASCFELDDAAAAVAFSRWIAAHVTEMRRWLTDPDNPLADSQSPQGLPLLSRHARLWEVDTRIIGCACHVLYRFTTGEACGPNMMTRNAHACNLAFIAPRFEQETGLRLRRVVLEANMGGDKKPSYQYFQEGHGKTVLAEATVTAAAMRRILHSSPEDVVSLQHLGMHGSHASGMQSAAFTPASAIAAIFAATGQDLGMVGTSSMAHATTELRDGGVQFTLRLPGLEVGTVGGGSVLPHARAWLRLLRCQGEGSAYRFAQLIAAASLCLEISAGAAMASNGSENFARAHLERGGGRIAWNAAAAPDGALAAAAAPRKGGRP